MKAGHFAIDRKLFNDLLGLPEDSLVFHVDAMSYPNIIRIAVSHSEGLPEVEEGHMFPELHPIVRVEKCEHGGVIKRTVEWK